MYSRAIKRLSAVIGDQDPSLLSSVMRSRGNHDFYQVRIGADTRPAADDLCNRIRRAGGACFVLRNFNRQRLTNRITGLITRSLDVGWFRQRYAATIHDLPVARAASIPRFPEMAKLPCGLSPGACARSPRRS